MHATLLVVYYLITHCNSFIIPNELPSILSVIYSNIPPVKVGIDSRFGYGFRLGPHADIQTLIEIGPQINTNQISTNGTVAKRQSTTAKRQYRLFKELSKKEDGKTDLPHKQTNKAKKIEKTLVGKIEFKKVPGIDGVNTENIKTSKNIKSNLEFPTKFVLI